MIDHVRLYAEPSPAPAPLRRIQRLAAPFDYGFLGLAGLTALFAVAVFIAAWLPGGHVRFAAQGGAIALDPTTFPPDYQPIAAFSPGLLLAGSMVFIIVYASLASGLYALHRLFRAYREGRVFEAEPIALMRKAGAALAIFAAAPGVAQPGLRALGSPDRNWFHGETLPLLLIGAGLFVFAHIIELGREIELENKGFI
ncbi:MAG: hypothetical protein RIA71_15640 [Oceanicaulis sp.]